MKFAGTWNHNYRNFSITKNSEFISFLEKSISSLRISDLSVCLVLYSLDLDLPTSHSFFFFLLKVWDLKNYWNPKRCGYLFMCKILLFSCGFGDKILEEEEMRGKSLRKMGLLKIERLAKTVKGVAEFDKSNLRINQVACCCCRRPTFTTQLSVTCHHQHLLFAWMGFFELV